MKGYRQKRVIRDVISGREESCNLGQILRLSTGEKQRPTGSLGFGLHTSISSRLAFYIGILYLSPVLMIEESECNICGNVINKYSNEHYILYFVFLEADLCK